MDEAHKEDEDHDQGHGGGKDHDNVTVSVLNRKTNRTAKFDVDRKTTTVSQAWDQSYSHFVPKEKKDPEDQFECINGTSLMQHLALTLQQSFDQHICPEFKYQIVGGTGGADGCR